MSSHHSFAAGDEHGCGCGGTQLPADSQFGGSQSEPAPWTVRITNPRTVVKKAAIHYRGAVPAALASYIPFGGLPSQNLWALVVVIAILVAGDIAVARHNPGISRN